ncbi:MAG TPA: flagellar basal body-associated FliL family protein [Cellvibrionaceae bacterium]
MKSSSRIRLFWLLVTGLLVFCMPLKAQDAAPQGSIYIPMEPPFVVNYGGVGRLKYLKTEISLRVADVHTASAVRHHMPLLRNALVMLFSRQEEDTINTQQGVEQLRQLAREELNALLASEGAPTGIVELYFNNLIIQQ